MAERKLVTSKAATDQHKKDLAEKEKKKPKVVDPAYNGPKDVSFLKNSSDEGGEGSSKSKTTRTGYDVFQNGEKKARVIKEVYTPNKFERVYTKPKDKKKQPKLISESRQTVKWYQEGKKSKHFPTVDELLKSLKLKPVKK